MIFFILTIASIHKNMSNLLFLSLNNFKFILEKLNFNVLLININY